MPSAGGLAAQASLCLPCRPDPLQGSSSGTASGLLVHTRAATEAHDWHQPPSVPGQGIAHHPGEAMVLWGGQLRGFVKVYPTELCGRSVLLLERFH